jgi:hypothetical protein
MIIRKENNTKNSTFLNMLVWNEEVAKIKYSTELVEE